MTNPKVMLYPLPHKIRGFICADDEGGELFILNSRLTREANQETMRHELEHAANGDVYRECDVSKLEKERHKKF